MSVGACLMSSASLKMLRASTARPERATTLATSLNVSAMFGMGKLTAEDLRKAS